MLYICVFINISVGNHGDSGRVRVASSPPSGLALYGRPLGRKTCPWNVRTAHFRLDGTGWAPALRCCASRRRPESQNRNFPAQAVDLLLQSCVQGGCQRAARHFRAIHGAETPIHGAETPLPRASGRSPPSSPGWLPGWLAPVLLCWRLRGRRPGWLQHPVQCSWLRCRVAAGVVAPVSRRPARVVAGEPHVAAQPL